jgi:carbohydrate-selective porin (OprB family)
MHWALSSLTAPNQWRLEEGWVQQNFFSSQLSILIGRYDLNTEFYRLQSAGLFLNSSFGVGPEFSQSGRNGPSIYSDTTSAIRIGYRPTEDRSAERFHARVDGSRPFLIDFRDHGNVVRSEHPDDVFDEVLADAQVVDIEEPAQRQSGGSADRGGCRSAQRRNETHRRAKKSSENSTNMRSIIQLLNIQIAP